MIAALASVFGLALIDSINPSALLVTLFLLAGPSPGRKILVYISTIFVVSLTLGIVLMLGLDLLLNNVSSLIDNSVVYAVQLAIGALMLLYAMTAPDKKTASTPALPKQYSTAALIFLGITVTLMEAPTAIPYLAAISILISAESSLTQWLTVLVIYNFIFIAPPLLLLVLQTVLGERIKARLDSFQIWLTGAAREGFLWIVGIVGFLLLRDALGYFEFFGLLEE